MCVFLTVYEGERGSDVEHVASANIATVASVVAAHGMVSKLIELACLLSVLNLAQMHLFSEAPSSQVTSLFKKTINT